MLKPAMLLRTTGGRRLLAIRRGDSVQLRFAHPLGTSIAVANAVQMDTHMRFQSTDRSARRAPRPSHPSRPKVVIANDWKVAVSDFERRASLHGRDGGYSAADIHSVVMLCVANGRHREAQNVVRSATSIGITTSPATEAVLCGLVARKGNVDRAFEMLHLLISKSPKKMADPRTYDALLTVLKERHDWENVRRVIQQMHEFKIEPPVRVFRVLLISAAKARQKDVVSKTIAHLRGRFASEHIDVATLTAMCQALTQVDETRQVMDIYHEIDQEWLAAKGNTILFNNFVLAALRKGRMQKAMEIFDRMATSEVFPPDDFTFATCILEFEKRGNWAEVIRVFNQMQDRELKGIANHPINALSCAAVIRAIHKQEGHSKQEIRRGIQVIIQRLPRVDTSHFGHTASLIDALDAYSYLKEAQTLFSRLVDTDVISSSWLRQNGYEVDLHSFSRGVAKCAVVHAFQQIRDSLQVRGLDDMRIITGVGKRSKKFLQPVVANEISQLLVRNYRPLIRPMEHPTNPGVLLIRRKHIQQWLEDGAVIRQYE